MYMDIYMHVYMRCLDFVSYVCDPHTYSLICIYVHIIVYNSCEYMCKCTMYLYVVAIKTYFDILKKKKERQKTNDILVKCHCGPIGK